MEIKKELTSIPVDVEYATPQPRLDSHHPLPAILLCMPGLLCWALFAGLATRRLPAGFLVHGEQLILPLLAAAVITAICSIVFYLFLGRLHKPWFVIFNLVVNVSGLLFLLLILVVGTMITAR